MIAAHRRRHRIVWIVLAAAIPLLLWLAVSARPRWPLAPPADVAGNAFSEPAP